MFDAAEPPRSPQPPGNGAVPGRVLVFGAGYLAGHIVRHLGDLGCETVVSSRRAPVSLESRSASWRQVDVESKRAVTDLMGQLRPDAVVVVHGPSDITWCEAHPHETVASHQGGARNIAAALDGQPVLLVSTDNVFAGLAESYGESAPTAPANVYGQAKLAAERELLKTASALVLRVSLVYGWGDVGPRPNFLTSTAQTLARGEQILLPEDHWNTPVLVDDVARWSAALLTAGRTGVLHLGGPRRIDRVTWARHIARALGADPSLVVPTPRHSTVYACRPSSACLHSELAGQLPELSRYPLADVLHSIHPPISI
ncbi:SDR family oxidoreductase [Streptomyces asiaticus]